MPADWLGGVRCGGGVTMYQAFLGNVGTSRADVKGEIQVVSAIRMRVPMQRTGTEQPVVAVMRRNVRGAKGLRHSVLPMGQPDGGGICG